MRKVSAFFCRLTLLFFLIGGVSLAAPITEVLVQNSALTPPYGNGSITYQSYGTSFIGSLKVSNLKVGMTYQMKLEGQPDDDLVGNDALGSIGRWWVIDPPNSRNITDAEVQGERNAGHTVLGYILFDSFTYTGGSMAISFYLDSSYRTANVPEPGRPAPGNVVMPDGSYTATFLITEDMPNWESPLLKSDITFNVPSNPNPTRVPVFNGWWLLMGIFPGLFLILRRVRRS